VAYDGSAKSEHRRKKTAAPPTPRRGPPIDARLLQQWPADDPHRMAHISPYPWLLGRRPRGRRRVCVMELRRVLISEMTEERLSVRRLIGWSAIRGRRWSPRSSAPKKAEIRGRSGSSTRALGRRPHGPADPGPPDGARSPSGPPWFGSVTGREKRRRRKMLSPQALRSESSIGAKQRRD